MSDLDWECLDGSIDIRMGGDGDIGEFLIPLLQIALEEQGLIQACTCGSGGGDAWKCATRLQLKTIACRCPCHRYLEKTK